MPPKLEIIPAYRLAIDYLYYWSFEHKLEQFHGTMLSIGDEFFTLHEA